MMSLGLTTAPDCHTGQSKGRYQARTRSIPIVVIVRLHQKEMYHHTTVQRKQIRWPRPNI